MYTDQRTFVWKCNAHYLALFPSQVIDNSGIHEDENTKKRREILARRPSYRKILNELGGCEISGNHH